MVEHDDRGIPVIDPITKKNLFEIESVRGRIENGFLQIRRNIETQNREKSNKK